MLRGPGSLPPFPPADPLGMALGVQFESAPVICYNAALAPSTQVVYGVALYATAGAMITGIKFRNSTAAAGTTPTTARFGLADNTGKILVRSANVNATSSWAVGVNAIPFTAPFTLAYSGVYFPCFVVNGTWGSTQPTPSRINDSPVVPGGLAADGSMPPPTFQWASQTDLPSVGASMTISTDTGNTYYLALY